KTRGVGEVGDRAGKVAGEAAEEPIGVDVTPAGVQPGKPYAEQEGDVGRGDRDEGKADPGPSADEGVDAERPDRGRDILHAEKGGGRPEERPARPPLLDGPEGQDEGEERERYGLVVLPPGVLERRVEEIGDEYEPGGGPAERGERPRVEGEAGPGQ